MKFNARSMAVFVAASALSFLLFITVSLYAINSTIANPNYIKSWLVNAKIYENIIDETFKLATTQKTAEANDTGNNNVQELLPVVQKTLTPKVIQTNTEAIIDGFGSWLSGDTPKPEFSLEIGPLRTSITNNVTDYLYNRVQALPICQQRTLGEFDPLTATCRPNVRINKQDFVATSQEFTANLPFMEYDTLTYETITNSTGSKSGNDLPQTAPKVYQWLKISPYIFGILAIIAAICIVFLRKDHARALKTVGNTLLIAGIFLIIAGIVAKMLIGKSLGTIGNSTDVQQAFAENIAAPLAQNLSSKLGDISLYFGVGFIVLSAICYVGAKFLFRRQIINKEDEEHGTTKDVNPKSNVDYKKPEPNDDQNSKTNIDNDTSNT